MRSAYVLIALTLAACGQQQPAQAPVTVDPALAPYMASFESDIGVSSAGISAQFADTSVYANPLGETVGECTVWTSNGTVTQRVIQIDSVYWNTLDQYGKIQLFYHEMGHCALYMQHITTDNGPGGCYTSIMYPIVFGETPCYQNNVSYYFQELSSHK
jgi:hypothetical protein